MTEKWGGFISQIGGLMGSEVIMKNRARAIGESRKI